LIELKPGTTLTLHDADRAQDFDYRFKGRRRHCGRPLFASQTMNVSLAVAAFGLGLAASPHCALMCGSTCAAITGARRLESIAFHAGRVVSYAAGGALAAASISAFSAWTRSSQALLPLWTLTQLAFLALGLWWLTTGRMPKRALPTGALPIRILRRRGPGAGMAGLAWVAWPCGVLQGALLLAALANTAVEGALVMASFAVASVPALSATPWLWARWKRSGGAAAFPGQASALGYRFAGIALAASSSWALWHSLHERFVALCSP
jgi:uncharacterized protein